MICTPNRAFNTDLKLKMFIYYPSLKMYKSMVHGEGNRGMYNFNCKLYKSLKHGYSGFDYSKQWEKDLLSINQTNPWYPTQKLSNFKSKFKIRIQLCFKPWNNATRDKKSWGCTGQATRAHMEGPLDQSMRVGSDESHKIESDFKGRVRLMLALLWQDQYIECLVNSIYEFNDQYK